MQDLFCKRNESNNSMMKMRSLFAFVFIFTISQRLSAQPYFDVICLQGALTRSTGLVSNEKFDASTDWGSAQLSYPKKFSNRSILAITLGYDTWKIKSTGSNHFYQSGYAPLTFIKPFSSDWKISFTGIPRFNKEQGTSTENTWQFGGAVIITKKINEHLNLKAGLYYNKEFFGNYFLPLAGGEWKVNERLYIFGLLPNNLFVDYKLSEKVHTGFIYKGVTTTFRLKEENYFDYIRLQEGQLKLFVDFYITRKVVINFEGGHTVAREYGFGFLDTKSYSAEFNDGYLLKAGLYYRMWL